jgi:hypothetical protein
MGFFSLKAITEGDRQNNFYCIEELSWFSTPKKEKRCIAAATKNA